MTPISAEQIQELESGIRRAIENIHEVKRERRATLAGQRGGIGMSEVRLEELLNGIAGDLQRCLDWRQH